MTSPTVPRGTGGGARTVARAQSGHPRTPTVHRPPTEHQSHERNPACSPIRAPPCGSIPTHRADAPSRCTSRALATHRVVRGRRAGARERRRRERNYPRRASLPSRMQRRPPGQSRPRAGGDPVARRARQDQQAVLRLLRGSMAQDRRHAFRVRAAGREDAGHKRPAGFGVDQSVPQPARRIPSLARRAAGFHPGYDGLGRCQGNEEAVGRRDEAGARRSRQGQGDRKPDTGVPGGRPDHIQRRDHA